MTDPRSFKESFNRLRKLPAIGAFVISKRLEKLLSFDPPELFVGAWAGLNQTPLLFKGNHFIIFTLQGKQLPVWKRCRLIGKFTFPIL